MKLFCAACVLCCLLVSPAALHAASPTVAAIRKAGELTCGIDQSEAEYSTTEQHGPRVAFDRDVCKAVAVAILGPLARVAVKGYPDSDTALQALLKGEVDLVPTVSDDFSHNTLPGVGLTRPVLLDGVGLLVLRASNISSAAGLANKKICFLDQTESELDLHSWFGQRSLHFLPFPFQEQGEMEAAFVTANCAALAGDRTRLANARANFGARSKDYVFLPEVLSADPLASAYRRDDAGFGNIVTWTEDVLLDAEALHVTSANATAMLSSSDVLLRRLLGATHELGRPLGLDDAWPLQVIQAVGNYGEVFERDLGAASPLRLPRGQNNLWSAGGLLQPLPLK
jgi:general L-amino acid transport system substrate-binding protein